MKRDDAMKHDDATEHDGAMKDDGAMETRWRNGNAMARCAR
jgi:hypothetical protein